MHNKNSKSKQREAMPINGEQTEANHNKKRSKATQRVHKDIFWQLRMPQYAFDNYERQNMLLTTKNTKDNF